MTKRRRLTDLYVLGKEVTVDDGQGEPVAVWLQKLNPVDMETAVRAANAQRSKMLSLRKFPDSDEYQSLYSQVYDFGDRSALIDYLLAPERSRLTIVREEEMATEEEWAKDDYLQGLRDAWEEKLQYVHGENPDDPDANRCFIELKRFSDTVDEIVEAEVENLRAGWEAKSDEALRDAVFDSIISMQADLEWIKEYRRCEIWLATREPENHKHPYFGSREEVDLLSSEVVSRLVEEYQNLSVDVMEGKDLPETDDSSTLSVQSPQAETLPFSGPKVVPQPN